MTTENNKKESEHDPKKYQRLFDYLENMWGGTALQSEMRDIIKIVHEDFPATPIEGEIKSKEEILNEIEYDLDGDQQYTIEDMKKAMEAYASQFTASKENDYREGLEKIEEKTREGVYDQVDVAELWEIANSYLSKALNK